MLDPYEYAVNRLASIAKTHPPTTGPRTPEGKKRSSQNATRHGLAGRIVVLPTEDLSIYAKFSKDLIDSLHPQTPLEHELAQTIADGYWRLRRVRTTEDSLFALGNDEGQGDFDAENESIHAAFTAGKTFRDHSRTFVNLSIYEQRIQRGIEKATKQLFELQAQRPAAAQPAPEPKRQEPVATEFVYASPKIPLLQTHDTTAEPPKPSPKIIRIDEEAA